VVRWRLVDLAAWLRDEFGITASRQTLGRELRRMGYRSLSARPQAHGQDPEAMAAFKKASRRPSRRSSSATPTAGR
jgi:transposase